METRTKDIPSLIEFVNSLKKNSLQPLIKELEQKPKKFSVYYDRPKEDWQKHYGLPGSDIHTFLHKQDESIGKTRTKDIPSLIEFVKELNEDSLEPLIKELKEEPSPFSVYYDRTEAQWLRRYPTCGDDIHTFLHKQDKSIGIDY
jgi:hypothetical protein